MKGTHPRITLLGSNSGKNLGDAAIMSAVVDVLTEELPDAEFFVPSTNPKFIDQNYGSKYNVKGVNVMPWTGSIRLFGLTTFNCLRKSDAALICDGIIFGKKFFNPTFNFLITLFLLAPIAKLLNCKLVCYSCGIGPFGNPWSRWAARSLLNNCDLVIMREHDSKKLAEEIGCTKEIPVTGDAAFINKVESEERAKQLAIKEGLDWNKHWFGINVTKYVDTWLTAEERLSDHSGYLEMLANGVKAAQQQVSEPFEPVVFCTHPMDLEFCETLAKKLNARVINNNTYLSHDIQALMRKCELFMGMRFHSVVLASAVYAPVIGLIYAPKVRGFMRLLECEQYGLELAQLSKESLAKTIASAWNIRRDLQVTQRPVIDALKAGARRAATTIRERYYPNYQAKTACQKADCCSTADSAPISANA